MAKINRGAGRPVYAPSPAIQTSINQGGRFRTPSQTDLRDWQDVIASDENLQGLQTPEERTNYLRAVWGLPSTYKIDAKGNIVDRNNVLLRNLWWIGPAAITGAGAIQALVAGGGTGAAAATGGPVAGSFGPTSAISNAAAMGLPPVAAGGAGGLSVAKVLKALAKYGLPIAAGGAALASSRTPKSENDLRRILGLAERNITEAQPLYTELLGSARNRLGLADQRLTQNAPLSQALRAMALAQLPAYTREG